MAPDLPCDGDGVCMVCRAPPPEAEVVNCHTCTTPWHAGCLSKPLETLAAVADWQCPDCSPLEDGGAALPAAAAYASGEKSDLISAVWAIEADASLTEREKAKRRQALVSGKKVVEEEEEEEEEEEGGKKKKKKKAEGGDDVLDLLDEKFNCSFCLQLPERPVTTPCGHNFCLKCFQKWVGQGKHTCAKCRFSIPPKMVSQPRINSALVVAIRMAKAAKSATSGGQTNVYHFIRNESRPEKAFTTERAKKAGKANACSGQIFVTIAPDHFGPILAENDPKRNLGVLVGEMWEDRMECRQWGAHFPHVAGIAGQSDYGAQSVALSGGYEDDEDHGDWFLYTGSGGRDLSGNKRTNKEQAFDQKFEKLNAALRVSCLKGYPVRVVRSHKEKRSSYAPESGVRYDGIYRIEKCWQKVGVQGYKVCRYLFVRCDNEPAPWTSDEHGDQPHPLPSVKELNSATDITERKESPAWDFDVKHGWRWVKSPPTSRKPVTSSDTDGKKGGRKAVRHAHKLSVRERLLKEFSCLLCRKVMTQPLTTPCGHNFCKSCLLEAFTDKSFVRERICEGGRTLRAQKIVKRCPSCSTDISDFLWNPQVNRDLMDLIESLEDKTEEEKVEQQIEDDTSEEGCSSANDTEEAAEEATEVQDIKLSKEESDNLENGKLDAAEGDSQVNVLGEKDGAEDTIDATNSELSCKRKNHLACRRGVKRTRNSESQ
ncbi:unnamed protein product [Musa acuminata subsp. malaccensis]|uniref:RING-type E3 ubiquitin transferase n=1 Tax=Musa acuminata subsp. malaccensis TaxID=214687 RepID=A0A804J5V6_MUSAM|nr:PREDICTED: E3 ubiquitin-protein ligase ORTHRUS 2-like [Musa acuminata subsp. malaccensis]CAG1838958.1 unnamed protein product [Musa acuminata subsp. malaccensis]